MATDDEAKQATRTTAQALRIAMETCVKWPVFAVTIIGSDFSLESGLTPMDVLTPHNLGNHYLGLCTFTLLQNLIKNMKECPCPACEANMPHIESALRCVGEAVGIDPDDKRIRSVDERLN